MKTIYLRYLLLCLTALASCTKADIIGPPGGGTPQIDGNLEWVYLKSQSQTSIENEGSKMIVEMKGEGANFSGTNTVTMSNGKFTSSQFTYDYTYTLVSKTYFDNELFYADSVSDVGPYNAMAATMDYTMKGKDSIILHNPEMFISQTGYSYNSTEPIDLKGIYSWDNDVITITGMMEGILKSNYPGEEDLPVYLHNEVTMRLKRK
ncbi:hypothetical protein COR50_19440 [Chitinophaga caeni]|uniref:Lipocalin-like domain-containing protein n=1 Tax=Chitinophaga caeni TaxID=2029983 RepID=A0A291QZA1_9BACT|nr:hypothetical protein [Chitinophaga caeni]ATL49173.1 hypothetical protein COR50_19440 [Chitinophaga caeni]